MPTEHRPQDVVLIGATHIRDRLHYLNGGFDGPETFEVLEFKVQGLAVFYCAVTAHFFGTIVDGLGQGGSRKEPDDHFRSVLIEKLFGSNLISAEQLNAQILKQAAEKQCYRIDHFLGEEAIQSMTAFRFANGPLEPVWRWEDIDSVQIPAVGTIGAEERGGYHEPTGALWDLVSNHLSQLLCMVRMEPPNSFVAEAVRSEKAKLGPAAQPIPPEDAVRGQYTAGPCEGRDVPADRDEHDVAKDSVTETYIAPKLHIENSRWAGVPIYVRTGKRMTGWQAEIAVLFKPAPFKMFADTSTADLRPTMMRITVHPEHEVGTECNVEVPAPAMRIGQVISTSSTTTARQPAECRLQDAALRPPAQRRDAVPAGRHH